MENRIDKLFPNRKGPSKPFPWLKITGGLNLMKFNVTHTLIDESLYIHIAFSPPLIENNKIDEISTYRFFSIKELEKLEDPREPILNLIRQIAEHEVLESLRVEVNNSFEPYYDEINVWHNLKGKDKLEQRLPTDPKLCKQLLVEVEPLIQYFE